MNIKKKLERKGEVAEVERERSRSFDLAFAEERAYLIKIVGNIESFTSEQAEALKKSAAIVNAKPVVLAESVKEGVVYTRHGVPTMRAKTFLEHLSGRKVAVADRGCVKVLIKNVRKIRERKGLSRGELARALGVSTEMVRRYEEGRAHPTEEVARKMVKILGKEILCSFRFESLKIRKAFIGKGPFEIGIREKKPILVSLRDDEVRVKNLERVSEVLDAKPVIVKEGNLEEIL